MKKRIWKLFLITDYDREERWLRDMHRQGWKLVNANLAGGFTFEKCPPAEVSYRLDIHPRGKEELAYQQLFVDYGWEQVTRCNGFTYFRKEVTDQEEPELYSDAESRLGLVKRIFYPRMAIIGFIFLAVIVPGLWGFQGRDGWLERILFFLYLVLAILYLLTFIYCSLGFRRLAQKEE